MIFPVWSLYAFAAALSLTAIPLIQEKFKADGFSLALWNKIIVTLVITPFVFSAGFPEDWKFYFYIFITSILFSVCDVVYFRSVPIIGSGLMTRLIPSSVVITFFLWFIVDPASIKLYTTHWAKILAVFGIFALFLYSAMHVKKCSVSWSGAKQIWPVIFAACTGGIFTKLALNHADPAQAIFATIFVQSLMMIAMLATYSLICRPVSLAVMTSRNTIKTSLVMGVVSSLPIFLKTKALQLADNPGLVSMILITDSLWVLLVYRLMGKRENGNLWAGIGIVTSAALLIIIKSFA